MRQRPRLRCDMADNNWSAILTPLTGYAAGNLFGGLLGGGAHYSDESQAAENLTRAQWSQAAAHLYPLESQLIKWAQSPVYAQQEANAAADNVTQAFNTQQTQQNQQLAYQGIVPNSEQQAALDKASALDQAAATAGAMNQASNAAKATQQSILTGLG